MPNRLSGQTLDDHVEAGGCQRKVFEHIGRQFVEVFMEFFFSPILAGG